MPVEVVIDDALGTYAKVCQGECDRMNDCFVLSRDQKLRDIHRVRL